jgi:tetratricopeptide (TPR) repeat protein
LQGLSREDVGRFIAGVSDKAASSELVEAVYEKTEGNPFFVTELVRFLAAEGCASEDEARRIRLTIPKTVKDVVRRRIANLGRESRELLEIASVVGREFDLTLLQAVSAKRALEALDLLDQAQRAQLIAEVPEGVNQYRFHHVLIRDTIYDDLTTLRRTLLHREVGRVLEELHHSDVESRLTQLAYHYCSAVAGGDQEKAVKYSIRAGQRAADSLAYEEAIDHFRRALRIVDSNPHGHAEIEKCEILLALGEAETRAGEWVSAKNSFRSAANVARRVGEVNLFARAAIGFKGMTGATGPVDVDAVALLREALAALKGQFAPLRVRVLSELAISLYFTEEVQEREDKSIEAVTLARELKEPATLGSALEARIHSFWRPSGLLEVLKAASEVVELAGDAASSDLAFRGQLFRYASLLSLGDAVLSRRILDVCSSLSQGLRHPRYLWQAALARAAWALSTGQIVETRELSHSANQFGRLVHDSSTEHYYQLQSFILARIEGRLHDLEAQLEEGARKYPRLPWYVVGLVGVYNASSRTADTTRTLELLERCGFLPLPDNMFLLFSLAILSEVYCGIGDATSASTLYCQLLPYANHNIVVSWGAACDGSVSHYLGLLASTLERWDDAVRHFEDALEMNGRMNFVPFVARTQHYYAATLFQRGQGDDRERAVGLLSAAITTYRRLGMQGYLRDALKVAASVPELAAFCEVPRDEPCDDRTKHPEVRVEPNASPTIAANKENSRETAESPRENLFRREGEYWTVCYRGRVVRLKNMRGLEYIALLLGQPGKEVHALDLSALIHSGAPSALIREGMGQPSKEDRLRVARLGDAGPVLDAKSRSHYRSRLGALGREVREAEQLNDVLKAAAGRREMQMLARELSAGTRRGGGSRLAGSYAERARINVRNNISAALRAIRRHDEELWRHLYRGVRTGTYCAYIPEAGVDWRL